MIFFLGFLFVCFCFIFPFLLSTGCPCLRCDLTKAEGKDHLPPSAGTSVPNASKDIIGTPSVKGTSLAHVKFVVHQDRQNLF